MKKTSSIKLKIGLRNGISIRVFIDGLFVLQSQFWDSSSVRYLQFDIFAVISISICGRWASLWGWEDGERSRAGNSTSFRFSQKLKVRGGSRRPTPSREQRSRGKGPFLQKILFNRRIRGEISSMSRTYELRSKNCENLSAAWDPIVNLSENGRNVAALNLEFASEASELSEELKNKRKFVFIFACRILFFVSICFRSLWVQVEFQIAQSFLLAAKARKKIRENNWKPQISHGITLPGARSLRGQFTPSIWSQILNDWKKTTPI